MPATMLERTGHRGETEYEFDLLKQYFEISELAISKAAESENERLQEAFGSVKKGAETYNAAMHFAENAGKFLREFPLKLRYGFIIQLYGLFETRARGLCKVLVEQRMTSSMSAKLPKQPQGFVLTFRDWIEKYTQGKSERWLAVEEMRLVRNCIAHASGLVAEAANLDELRRILTQKRGAYEDEFGFVAIEKQFCDAAHQDVSRLLDDIYQTTKFGAPLFLRRRQPAEIVIMIERKENSTVFGVTELDQEL